MFSALLVTGEGAPIYFIFRKILVVRIVKRFPRAEAVFPGSIFTYLLTTTIINVSDDEQQ